MFFFGILSTQLTYLIIAAVYICGYGTIALKSDRKNVEELTSLQVELKVQQINECNNYSDDSYLDKKTCISENNKLLIKAQNTLFNKKQIPLFGYTLPNYKSIYSNIITSRPPPFFV